MNQQQQQQIKFIPLQQQHFQDGKWQDSSNTPQYLYHPQNEYPPFLNQNVYAQNIPYIETQEEFQSQYFNNPPTYIPNLREYNNQLVYQRQSYDEEGINYQYYEIPYQDQQQFYQYQQQQQYYHIDNGISDPKVNNNGFQNQIYYENAQFMSNNINFPHNQNKEIKLQQQNEYKICQCSLGYCQIHSSISLIDAQVNHNNNINNNNVFKQDENDDKDSKNTISARPSITETEKISIKADNEQRYLSIYEKQRGSPINNGIFEENENDDEDEDDSQCGQLSHIRSSGTQMKTESQNGEQEKEEQEKAEEQQQIEEPKNPVISEKKGVHKKGIKKQYKPKKQYKQSRQKNVFKNFGNAIVNCIQHNFLIKDFIEKCFDHDQVAIEGFNEQFLKGDINLLKNKEDFLSGWRQPKIKESSEMQKFKQVFKDVSIKFFQEYAEKYVNESDKLKNKDIHIKAIPIFLRGIENVNELYKFKLS